MRRTLRAILGAALLAGCHALQPLPSSSPVTPVGTSAGTPLSPPVGAPASIGLEFLGQQRLPHAYRYNDTTVGGLSGLDFDTATGRYVAISDDRSELQPSRFYRLSLDLARFNRRGDPGYEGVVLHEVRTLRRPDGSAFPDYRTDPAHAADPESIRVHRPSGRLVWSSEGDRATGNAREVLVDPHVWEIDRDGGFVRALPLPDKFRASATERGIRRNLAFEGLAFSPDYTTLFVATENALLQDGPVASLTASSPSRIIAYDFASGHVVAEYVVDVAPIPIAPRAGGFADNGISEILALTADRLLVMERSFAQGVGNTIRLFEVDLRGATNVAGLESLAGQAYAAAPKRLVLDLATLGIRLDNFEGMTWGPMLPDGRRSLVLVSDDNFNPQQATLFFAFAVDAR